MSELVQPPLELWAGVECTLNRVGDHYFDQLALSGHESRLTDLDLFAALGVRALRYPILWERHCPAPGREEEIDWAWADERLGRLRALGVRPIVGFVHHGSGPRWTHLLDPGFAAGLARFAAAFARRYPWVEDYTPINEPLTTARFSALYGFWYPHAREDGAFARALLHQCQAVAHAMAAVRAVNPAARLVQTEDLGQVYSTTILAYQADFENQRRWLTYDLLAGRVDPRHPLWGYLRGAGRLAEAELSAFVERPTPPTIVGVNYYLTSDRFLDHRLERYPTSSHGGNGRHRYADVAAVRVRREGITGHQALLMQAAHRYSLPLAVTEVHVGCTREEQLRWLREAFDEAQAARAAGVDVRAIAAWSLLGATDWDSLVTQPAGHYESGVFTLSQGEPRPTVLATLLTALASDRAWDHPVLATPGWWRRRQRLLHPPVATCRGPRALRGGPRRRQRPLLITGAYGTLGAAFGRVCQERGLRCRQLGHGDLDIADPSAVAAALADSDPWAVINAAGSARIDEAERDPAGCHRAHTAGPELLARACRERGLALLTFSSAQVFDGTHRFPYRESDPVAPLSTYGRSKAEAERRVLALHAKALVVRTSALFGPWDERNFVTRVLRALRAGRRVRAARDVMVTPTYVPELVRHCLDLLIDQESGLWHIAGGDAVSWASLAQRAAELAGCDARPIEECAARELGFLAPRPLYSALGSERGVVLQQLPISLDRYLREGAPVWARDEGQREPPSASMPGGA